MSTDQGWSASSEQARLRADILRAYRRYTKARDDGYDRLARIAEDEMNRLLDRLPRPREPLDDANSAATEDGPPR